MQCTKLLEVGLSVLISIRPVISAVACHVVPLRHDEPGIALALSRPLEVQVPNPKNARWARVSRHDPARGVATSRPSTPAAPLCVHEEENHVSAREAVEELHVGRLRPNSVKVGTSGTLLRADPRLSLTMNALCSSVAGGSMTDAGAKDNDASGLACYVYD